MDIKTFVSQALTQIAEGIVEAQAATSKSGARLNPPLRGRERVQEVGDTQNYIPQEISFDVMVTVEASKATEGEGKIKVAVFDIGANKSAANRDTSTSRITFNLPVVWPLGN